MIRSNVTWINENIPELRDKILVTLSMEGCIPELVGDAREANVKGGLGIYFGDKLEGLKTIGMDRAFGCMPLYNKRLVQSIRNGRQHIEYRDVSYEDQPVESVTDDINNPIQFDVWGWNIKDTAQEKQYRVEVFSINRGGTLLYLFQCPDVFDVLYPDDRTHYGYGREHRFLQETVFAECVYELLKRINVVPDIIHLNEGHVADAAAIIKGDEAFSKTTVVYTNHTVVPAGMERFDVDRITRGDVGRARYAMRFLQRDYEKFWHKFSTHHDGRCIIDFSKGAIEICDIANGVSGEHAKATQSLFPAYDRQVEAVLNGSGDTWVIDELLEAKLKEIALNKETLLRIAADGKAQSFAEIKKRTAAMTDRNGNLINEDGVTLNPDLPTVWMVRRMVRYKSQLPVLNNIIHAICADRDEEIDTPFGRMNGLQMQVVIGGIAPEGSCEESWVEEFVSWMCRPELKGRFVYVPNADTVLLKMQAIGADICINCPLPEQEACGTSDQRSALNGGINIATRSGGPFEYIKDGSSGMLVGPYRNETDFYERAPGDILYKLEQLSDMYFNQEDGDNTWLDMKLESYLASSKVTAAAMEQRYASLYARTLHISTDMVYDIRQESNKRVHIHKTPEPVLHHNKPSYDLLYGDSLLANWKEIAGLLSPEQLEERDLLGHKGNKKELLNEYCIEGKRYDYLRTVMKNYFDFIQNSILSNLVSKKSLSQNGNYDISMLLVMGIIRYLERTKNCDFLDTITDKQTTIMHYILREIIDTSHKEIEHEDKWLEVLEENCQVINNSIDI
jgi:glycogen phosphorylase